MIRLGRWAALALIMALGVVLIAAPGAGAPGGAVWAQEGEGETHADALAPWRGAAVYAEFCQACHGPRGEARGTGPAFPAITFEPEAARRAILEGGGAMPAYAAVLSAAQIDAVLAYMGTWASGEVPPLPAPNVPQGLARVPGTRGDPDAGVVLYAQFCAGCHGAQGQGRGVPGFPPLAWRDGESRAVLALGAGAMPGFSVEVGGPLSASQLADLESYLATWAGKRARPSAADPGLAVMVIVAGVVALLIVGATYILRTDGAGPAADEDVPGAP